MPRPREDLFLWEPPLHPWVRTGEVAFKPINQTEESVSAKALAECSLTLLPAGTVLVAMYGQGKTRGQSALLNVAATTNQACLPSCPARRMTPNTSSSVCATRMKRCARSRIHAVAINPI